MRVPSIVSATVFCGAIASAASPAFAQREVRPVVASQANGHWIGVRCFDLPEVVRAQLDVAENQGVLVDDVVAGSPAEKAGLRRFDVIVAIGSEPVGSPMDLANAVAESDGSELTIEYLRAGKRQSLKVTPERRPMDFPPAGRDEVERAMRRWLEGSDRPMSLRFFHPGMVLPPGTTVRPSLPDDMTVTIEKKGEQPAEITVERSGERWQATEESLDRLPREARQYVERTLGAAIEGQRAFATPRGPGKATAGTETGDAQERLKQKLEEIEELKQKIGDIDELKRQIEELNELKRAGQR